MFIRMENLYKIYHPGPNEVRALDGVSLSVEEGEFLAIVGHSGSGKSTLMNMLGCLDVPSSGAYFLEGRDVSLLTDDELSEIRNQHIGFIFQGFNLIPGLDALENVELPLLYRGLGKAERRRLALEALRRVGLEQRIHPPARGDVRRPAAEGGHRPGHCRRPPLILADEPTGNLDTRSGEEVMDILWDLNAEGRTVILITHDNDIASAACRIVRIQDGRILEDIRPSHDRGAKKERRPAADPAV